MNDESQNQYMKGADNRKLMAALSSSNGRAHLKYESQAKPSYPMLDFKLEDIFTEETLLISLGIELKKKKAAGDDGKDVDTFVKEFTPSKRLDLRNHLINGTYYPKRLRMVEIPKANGKMRRISIPSVQDRVVQRILSCQLGMILEPLLNSNTMGYRSGINAEDALLKCSQFIRSGYEVLETDIESFYDSVNRDRLMANLKRLTTNSEVHLLVKRFNEVNRVFDGKVLTTPKLGIPQGNSLSPVLSNLYLMDLDSNIIRAGFQFVRYADDLVIFFMKNSVNGQGALPYLQKWLRELGLNPNDDKTKVIDLERGDSFKFLGLDVYPDGRVSHLGKRIEGLAEFSEFIPLLRKNDPHGWNVDSVSRVLRSLSSVYIQRLNFIPNLRFSHIETEEKIQALIKALNEILSQKGEIRRLAKT